MRFVVEARSDVVGSLLRPPRLLESVDDLARRIETASKYVPLDRLAVSPQCGFATSVLGNALTIDDERAKLGLVAQAARKVWG
jgi:5-methyltetrahydropteroyltriglutamate--homocysteine methyltransferase